MREILFKARAAEDREWVCGGLFIANDETVYIVQGRVANGEVFNFCIIRVDPETVCQFIGLTDKNGEMVFEDDLVMLRTGRVCKVVRKTNRGYCGFDLEAVAEIDNPAPKFAVFMDCEVIGNIHDKEGQA